MKINFIQRLEKENACLLLGTSPQGIDCYYYIEVLPHKYDELLNLPAGSRVTITDFGRVIEKGYGKPT